MRRLNINSLLSDPTVVPDLPDRCIHIWCAPLPQPAEIVSRFEQTLSEDELKRSEKFYFEKDRRHFIVGRGLLRYLLGAYLNIKPTTVLFEYNQFGKPLLSKNNHPHRIAFNLSHSHEWVLYAIIRDAAIGIDLEFIRPDFPATQIAQRFFAPEEVERLSAENGQAHIETFYQYWVRKEAYIKALEKGLSIPLNQFDISRTPDKPVLALNEFGLKKCFTNWHIKDLKTLPGYAAALAFREPQCRLLIHYLDNAGIATKPLFCAIPKNT